MPKNGVPEETQNETMAWRKTTEDYLVGSPAFTGSSGLCYAQGPEVQGLVLYFRRYMCCHVVCCVYSQHPFSGLIAVPADIGLGCCVGHLEWEEVLVFRLSQQLQRHSVLYNRTTEYFPHPTKCKCRAVKRKHTGIKMPRTVADSYTSTVYSDDDLVCNACA